MTIPVSLRRHFRYFNLVRWYEIIYSAMAKMSLKKCGGGLSLRLGTVIAGHENITLGDNFRSNRALYMYANDGGLLEVGDNCSINTNVQLGASGGRLVIGNDVMIASNVVIRVANHNIWRDFPVREQPLSHNFGEVHVEDDVWIGANSVITSGVTLRVGTVVGAGAVVTKSTEPYSIVAGVPARKIGERRAMNTGPDNEAEVAQPPRAAQFHPSHNA
jgi:galactoside O-acetyltransferase